MKIDARRRRVGRELAASIWVSDVDGHLIAAPLHFNKKSLDDPGLFPQETAVVLPLTAAPRELGRAIMDALLAFRGAEFSDQLLTGVTGDNYPPVKAVGLSMWPEFSRRYRTLLVRTNASLIEVEMNVLDDIEETTATLDVLGHLDISCQPAELGSLVLRVFRATQTLTKLYGGR